jgi:selenide, water dikinase
MDRSRRKAVMTRSIKLGHCVCDPKKPCPCDVFKAQDVCLCAGERLPVRTEVGGLTQHVRKAGCASKIGQEDLLGILSRLPAVADPAVLVGTAAGDDAGIYKLSDTLALVQTVDVFTPCVDDAYAFGQIAAANSVSDVYAMGGRPVTALSIIGFPIETLGGEQMEAMMRGGIDKLNEAGCALIGGHSINDEEIKFGFAVTGLIHPDRVVCRDRAKPGDALVLTKPLGTGMLAFAAQIERVAPDVFAEAQAGMATLNKDAAELMVELGAGAATDVTGFGLAGHLVEMAKNSGVDVDIRVAALPLYEGVERCIADGVMPGAVDRNQAYTMRWVQIETTHPSLPVVFDPQTSGGLLVALSPENAERFVQAMHARGHRRTCIIGRVLERAGAESRVRMVD